MTSPWFGLGHGHDELADRLEQDRVGLRQRLLQPDRRRDLERHLGAVDRVVLAVEARDLHVDDGEAERAAVLHRLGDALLDRGDELRGITPPTIASTNSLPAPRSRGLDAQPRDARTGRGRRSAS